MDKLKSCTDLNFDERDSIDRYFERVLYKRYDDEDAWANALPKAVEIVSFKLKEFEETDWTTGRRGNLTEEGLTALSDVFRRQMECANRSRKLVGVGNQSIECADGNDARGEVRACFKELSDDDQGIERYCSMSMDHS